MPPLTQQQFLDELKKVEFENFPTLAGGGKIKGIGLNKKNAYRYTREKSSSASLPFKINFDTYVHFYDRGEITSADVKAFWDGRYSAYETFWLSLMVKMGLAEKISNHSIKILKSDPTPSVTSSPIEIKSTISNVSVKESPVISRETIKPENKIKIVKQQKKPLLKVAFLFILIFIIYILFL